MSVFRTRTLFLRTFDLCNPVSDSIKHTIKFHARQQQQQKQLFVVHFHSSLYSNIQFRSPHEITKTIPITACVCCERKNSKWRKWSRNAGKISTSDEHLCVCRRSRYQLGWCELLHFAHFESWVFVLLFEN